MSQSMKRVAVFKFVYKMVGLSFISLFDSFVIRHPIKKLRKFIQGLIPNYMSFVILMTAKIFGGKFQGQQECKLP